jgi:NAD(P)-dependent dehydrogenase (short-subunit alcohol dehydrogenase family)
MEYKAKYDLSGQIAIVTGAARGIGLELAKNLSQCGATVVVTDLDAAGADKAARQILEDGGSALGIGLDVTVPDDVQAVHDQVFSKYGCIDILVNNAGIALSDTPAEDMSQDRWLKVIDVNLNGTFWTG